MVRRSYMLVIPHLMRNLAILKDTGLRVKPAMTGIESEMTNKEGRAFVNYLCP